MALLIVYDAATAIHKQTNRRLFPLRISERERVSWTFFNFCFCSEIWFGLNGTGHPDWVKMFGDSNGQIKLRAKQKIQVSFCYSFSYLWKMISCSWPPFSQLESCTLIPTLWITLLKVPGVNLIIAWILFLNCCNFKKKVR